jgi:hypothetical protein
MSIKGGMVVNAKPREATVHAVVTRADGTVEDLGLISYYHKNPFIRAYYNARIKIRDFCRKRKTK